MPALKLLVIGPSRSGKTSIANYVSGHYASQNNQKANNNNPQAGGAGASISSKDVPYEPTVGVRILESETAGKFQHITMVGLNAKVELFECYTIVALV